MKLNRNAVSMKEPFSREIRSKMASKQKHLPGNAKHMKSVGSLKKSEFELLGHWAAGTIPLPVVKDEKPAFKPKSSAKKESKQKKEKKQKRKKTEKEKDEPVEKKAKKSKGKKTDNGYKKVSDGKLSELDLVREQLAQVQNPYFFSIFNLMIT